MPAGVCPRWTSWTSTTCGRSLTNSSGLDRRLRQTLRMAPGLQVICVTRSGDQRGGGGERRRRHQLVASAAPRTRPFILSPLPLSCHCQHTVLSSCFSRHCVLRHKEKGEGRSAATATSTSRSRGHAPSPSPLVKRFLSPRHKSTRTSHTTGSARPASPGFTTGASAPSSVTKSARQRCVG